MLFSKIELSALLPSTEIKHNVRDYSGSGVELLKIKTDIDSQDTIYKCLISCEDGLENRYRSILTSALSGIISSDRVCAGVVSFGFSTISTSTASDVLAPLFTSSSTGISLLSCNEFT